MDFAQQIDYVVSSRGYEDKSAQWRSSTSSAMLNNGDWMFEVSCTEYSQNESRDDDRVRAVTMMLQTVRELGFTGPMREVTPSGLPVHESLRVINPRR